MKTIFDPVINSFESLLEWLSVSLKQTTGSYCELETAFDNNTLVARDGSLVSIVKINGLKVIPGKDEFEHLHEGICEELRPSMARPGHSIQVIFGYDLESVKSDIRNTMLPSIETAKRLSLDLQDLFDEKINYLSNYCAQEQCYLAVWTTAAQLSKQQLKHYNKTKLKALSKNKVPPMKNAQSLFAPITELVDAHYSLVRSLVDNFNELQLSTDLLDVYTALQQVRLMIDPNFTARDWQPYLPGDKIPLREKDTGFNSSNDISELMWPALSSQLIPRDGENIDLRTARVGDNIYAPIFIDLFPKDIKIFNVLLQRVLSSKIPWRVSFTMEASGLASLNVKSTVASILSFANRYNRLISDSKELLNYIDVNTDDSVVKLRVALVTWAPASKPDLLRTRSAELSKAVQSWGRCDIAEISGDSFGAVMTTVLGIARDNISTASVAPLSDVVKMLPVTRPASLWQHGAMLLRSPDGKLMPYQPGSTVQTTWIDLIYARPGSGKSVLSNAINFALCLAAGKERLPRIGIIDIGPSSSGLISLLKEALPSNKKHLVAYHRLQMNENYAINPFDTQLGCRAPIAAERSFLVNFLTLLATPVAKTTSYDGIADMVGMIIDEAYKNLVDDANPNKYVAGMDEELDKCLHEIGCKFDEFTSWWEVTDTLFKANKIREATLAQRYAVPVLSDLSSICRLPVIEDLYGKITIETGETLIDSFGRMISSAIREYPIIASTTKFDIGESRVISLDLDEVAKTGGESADRQTAIMYMMARYILGRNYYLTNENLHSMPDLYKDFHKVRIKELREDPKRLVMDEFHRTSKSKAVRDQVIVDMREGRKWNVQICLASQSIDDFDSTMVEFATSVFIMDAGPVSSIEKTAKTFGLNLTEKNALRLKVHGPRAGGGTFLAQFATKYGISSQLLTNTLGPSELWALSTTAQDARIRNELYDRIGPVNARNVLGHMFPNGSAVSMIEHRLLALKDTGEITPDASKGIINQIIEEIVHEFNTNSVFRSKDKQPETV